jgi:hypothetical protein
MQRGEGEIPFCSRPRCNKESATPSTKLNASCLSSTKESVAVVVLCCVEIAVIWQFDVDEVYQVSIVFRPLSFDGCFPHAAAVGEVH